VRDALSILDQVIAFAGRSITPADVATVLGLSETTFFARLVSLIGEGDHAGILEALQETAESGRDFKMLFRDLLNFLRNLLLVASGANEAMLSASPEDLAVIRATAEVFTYTELLRIANLLMRDDDTVNRAEHQRLAVEIALLKAATFPRLRAVEEALSGAPASTPAGPAAPRRPRRDASQPAVGTTAFLERAQKARPLIGSYLANARSNRRDGDRLIFTFADAFTADAVRDARAALEELAKEVFGAPVTIEVELEDETPSAAKGAPALREDPVVKAFQKHLGGEVVESRKR
jgi:DNA polymerase III gamma/tau subunit